MDDVDLKEECQESIKVEVGGIIKHHEDSMDSQLSGFSDMTSHGSDHESQKAGLRSSTICEDVNEDSHLSNVSSNSRYLHV